MSDEKVVIFSCLEDGISIAIIDENSVLGGFLLLLVFSEWENGS